MNRRALLTSVAAGTTGLAGCLGTLGSDSSDGPATLGASATPPCSPSLSGDSPSALPYCLLMTDPRERREWTPASPPRIAVSRTGSRLVVTGGTYYGSSGCDEIAVETLELREENELRIVVGPSTRDPRPRTCTADMAYSTYELVVATGGHAVDTVRVTERSADGEPTHRTATVPDR